MPIFGTSSRIILAGPQPPAKAENSVLTMSDDQIMNIIYATHVHGDEKLDIDSLFAVTENILQRATHLVDIVVLPGTETQLEHLDDKVPKASFSPPSCTLKALSCEMSCKAPGEEIAHKTTLSILDKLAHYPWHAKAVLTLAAFALDYGDFWMLADRYSKDELAKSLGIMKRVPVIFKSQKYVEAIVELNNLIKATWEVIESIFELEKLTGHCDTKDVPALAGAMDLIPVDVYFAIITVVACTTQKCCITGDEGKTQELSPFAQKINVILNVLRKTIKLAHEQRVAIEAYWELKKLFQTPTEVMEVFKKLIFLKDAEPELIDGSTNKLVSIDVLKKKDVLFFISCLDITILEISILKPVYDVISKKDDQRKIIWIPIVEHWTDDLIKKFDELRAKMPWYAVKYFSSVLGIKFIREEWNFKNKPIVVVMNPRGKVEHPNALHIIRVWGPKAFPFTIEAEDVLRPLEDVMIYIMDSVIIPTPPTEDDKYYFFYGGKDNEWVQQFTKKAIALKNDQVIKIKERISIELVLIGKKEKGQDDVGILKHFWDKIESFYFFKTGKKTEPDAVTREIQKLLSYKNESGWVVLSKGSKVIFTGEGKTVTQVVNELEIWKGDVPKSGFEDSFKRHYDKLIAVNCPCIRVDFSLGVGMVPENMHCPHCSSVMETYFSFKCCHVGGFNSLH